MRALIAAVLEILKGLLDKAAIFAAGQMAERSRANAQSAEIREAQLRAAGDRPRDRGDLTGRLRSGRF
jgi:hypothetical protein